MDSSLRSGWLLWVSAWAKENSSIPPVFVFYRYLEMHVKHQDRFSLNPSFYFENDGYQNIARICY